jgi:hypothetical protein
MKNIKTLAEDEHVDEVMDTISPSYNDECTETIRDLCDWAYKIESKLNEVIKKLNEHSCSPSIKK